MSFSWKVNTALTWTRRIREKEEWKMEKKKHIKIIVKFIRNILQNQLRTCTFFSLQEKFRRNFFPSSQPAKKVNFEIVGKLAEHSVWCYTSLEGKRSTKLCWAKLSEKALKKMFILDFWGKVFKLKHAKFREGGEEGSFVFIFYLLCAHSPLRIDYKFWTKNDFGASAFHLSNLPDIFFPIFHHILLFLES